MNKIDKKPDSSTAKKSKKAVVRSGPERMGEDRYQRRLLLLLLGLVLTLIIVPKGGLIPDYYEPGDIVSRDIKAPKDLLIPDLPLTEKKRQQAQDAVLPLYDFDAKAGQGVAERWEQALELIRTESQVGPLPESQVAHVGEILGTDVSQDEFSGLLDIANQKEAMISIGRVIIDIFNRKIVGNLELFQAERERGIVLRDLVSQKETTLTELSTVIGLDEAQQLLSSRLKGVDGFNSSQRKVLDSILKKQLRPSLTFNKNETEARKQQAREAVKPVLFQVKKGEMIVREGSRVTEEQIKKLKALRDIGSDTSTLRTAAGLLVSILILVFCTHRFARQNIRKYHPKNRDLLFLVCSLIGLFILIKIAIFISTALESAFPYIDSASYFYVFPFAVGAMLVRIVLNSEIAFMFALLSSLFLGVLFGNSLLITFYALVSSLTGAHWVKQCKQRTTLYYAGLRISMINVLVILGVHLMAGRAFDMQLLYKLGFGLAGGFFCAVIVTGTIPLVEYLFKYTTDIKLLELANMNNPLLRELMVQAPGTYHHSIIVGNLVESAAETINANPLLARVAAYYHDIGKIRKPLYFVENIRGMENKHDKLAPSMSALILMSHVKDGVEMAREHKLGDPLVDIIREHHGTALIKFFFDKAKSKEDADVQQVDERDYRYPGPKPQTREAALIMLADAVEAASRTLTDSSPARIQGLVQKIINNIFIDGQLDECELTLKDLHNIAKSFNRVLAGIFHNRIDYPEPAYKEKDPTKRKTGEDTNREPPKESKDKETPPPKGSTEDLKRLGMS